MLREVLISRAERFRTDRTWLLKVQDGQNVPGLKDFGQP